MRFNLKNRPKPTLSPSEDKQIFHLLEERKKFIKWFEGFEAELRQYYKRVEGKNIERPYRRLIKEILGE